MKPSEVMGAIEDRREQRLRAGSSWARNNPVASDLHPCARYMVLAIKCWAAKPPFPTYAREAMENGNVMEPVVVRQLNDEGWAVIRQQETVEVRGRKSNKMICRGRIDGFLSDASGVFPDLRVPFDAKDVSMHIFNRIRSEEDIRQDRWCWKWWNQAQLYMIALGVEDFLIYMSHRGQRRAIWLELDLDEADRILDLCESTVGWVERLPELGLDNADGELNDAGLEYSPEPERFCRYCDFQGSLCQPPFKSGTPEDALVRDDLADVVERHEELSEAKSEYDKLDRVLKSEVEPGSHAVAGDYFLTGEWREIRRKAVESKPERTEKQWRRSIRKVN